MNDQLNSNEYLDQKKKDKRPFIQIANDEVEQPLVIEAVEEKKDVDKINPNLRPLETNKGLMTFRWIKPVIQLIKKQKTMNICDIHPMEDGMRAKISGKILATQWNQCLLEHRQTGKPMASINAQIFRFAKKRMGWLFLFVPLTAIAQLCSPLSLQEFSSILLPATYYDCEQMFSANPQFALLSYGDGLIKTLKQLWGYLVLVLVSGLVNTMINNLSFSLVIKSGITGINGLIDVIYQKILLLSDQTRQSSASGNIVNLLFTDTQRLGMMFSFLHMIFQVPVSIVIYIIYLGVKITPIALTGLLAYLIIFPCIGILVGKIIVLSKRIMSIRDMRVKRANEVMNGIRIIKLFSLEKVQYARLQNARNKEISALFYMGICMSCFFLIATVSAPLMTCIAFVTMIFTDQFNLSTAFTTMYLFTYLAFSIVFLPMMMSALSDAVISAERLKTFICLPEKDPGLVVNRAHLTNEQLNKVNKLCGEGTSIKITGNPSFTWSLANDKMIPPILDPFYKQNQQTLKQINRSFTKYVQKYQILLSKHVSINENQDDQVGEKLLDLKKEEIDELLQAVHDKSNNVEILDRWCLDFDIPYISRLSNLEQYNFAVYLPEKKESFTNILKKKCLHIQTMRFFKTQTKVESYEDSPSALKNIQLEVQKGQLIGICGQVGNGKTSLFNAMLGELRLSKEHREKLKTYLSEDGINQLTFDYFENEIENDPRFDSDIPHIYLNGKVAYFSQQAHIFSRTVRENILFGMQYDEQKYKQVLKMCCLEDDLKIFAAGDQTEIGGKGVTLSGGQKARVSLARAIYSDSDIYLLDDPLSAVDSHVGKTIWEEAIMGYLHKRGFTVLIASHQTQYFHECDKVLQLVNGEIKAFDTVQNLVQQGIQILGLSGDVVSQEISTSEPIKENNELKAKPVEEDDEAKGKTISQEVFSAKGNVSSKMYKKWFLSGSMSLACIMIIGFILQQGVQQYQTIMVSDWATDKYGWTTDDYTEEQIQNKFKNISVDCSGYTLGTPLQCQMKLGQVVPILQTPSNISTQNKMQSFLLCAEGYGINIAIPEMQTSMKYLGLYIGLTFLSLIISFVASISFTTFSLSISKKLHNDMLNSLLHTKTAFFDTTPQGRILNRLSKDTDSVDSNILRFSQASISTGLVIIGMIISIACVNWPCIFVIVPCLITFLLIFATFRSVFPQIKRLEAITRSPVFNICNETVDSLVSIRAFGYQQKLISDFRSAVNTNSSLYFQQFAIIRWLWFQLGMLTSAFALLITIVSILIAPINDTIAKYTGVIVSYGFSISNIIMQFVITLVSLEGEMAAVERIMEYGSLPSEGVYVKENINLHPLWPKTDSSLEVKNLSLKYRPELPLVLNSISFALKENEHVGIVGRTGAGKSSITVAMYRLAEPEIGSQIIVDGVNILEVGLHQARKAFTIIPQDPFLFSGTLRQCLCPFSQAEAEGVQTTGLRRLEDDEIWKALEQVRMHEYFAKQPGGLETKIAANGDNLSAGQKQLVCVARALLKKAACVILDEATAQVDRENDQLIQETIRTAFANVTVLCIAHRLDTIIDFDRVIVMENGNIAEFDTPANLIRANGAFMGLLKRTGEETSKKLQQMAFDAEATKKK